MTDFVFLLRNKTTSELCRDYPNSFRIPEWKGDQSEMVKKMLAIDAIQWKLVGEYAKFLKQPLKLEMFVPLSKTGSYIKEVMATEKIYHEELKQAKSKVLFKNITVLENDDKYISFKTKNIAIFVYDKITESFVVQNDWDVERLVKLNMELTESAIKRIFG